MCLKYVLIQSIMNFLILKSYHSNEFIYEYFIQKCLEKFKITLDGFAVFPQKLTKTSLLLKDHGKYARPTRTGVQVESTEQQAIMNCYVDVGKTPIKTKVKLAETGKIVKQLEITYLYVTQAIFG